MDRVLEKQQGTDRLLLVVDQWEELYTHRPPKEKAAAEHTSQVNRFIDKLLAAGYQPRSGDRPRERRGRQNAVRWQHELLDPARRLLADAGLLEAMERKTDVATAFCRWLRSRLGFEVRLPDEWEWQWAAQGARKGFVYPWGDDWQEGLANRSEAGIGRTTAVGMYSGGRSAQRAYDLADNVWEWCRNEYVEPNRT